MFAPRDRVYFELFEGAGRVILHACELLDEMMGGFPDSKHLAQEINACEHEGDRITTTSSTG